MKPRLAIVCRKGLDTFVKPLVPFWAPHFSIRTFLVDCDDDVRLAYEWANSGGTVFCEWANETAVAVTNHQWKPSRVVVRLHSYEAFNGPMLASVDWGRVDAVCTVAEHVKEIAQNACPALRNKDVPVIPNGIDLARFPYTDHDPGTGRRKMGGSKLGVVGYINHKKGPMLWTQVLAWASATIHVAGSFQDMRYWWYLRHIAERLGVGDQLHFDGWQDDVGAWWADKHFALSCSPHEGHPLNILEAMACGVKPLIHWYFGAEKQWPEACLWRQPSDIQPMIEEPYDSAGYRAFASEFTTQRTAEALLPLLVG